MYLVNVARPWTFFLGLCDYVKKRIVYHYLLRTHQLENVAHVTAFQAIDTKHGTLNTA